MEAAVNEISGDIHQQRPFRRIGANQRYVVAAQELDEFAGAETFMPDLDGVAKRQLRDGPRPIPTLEPLVMPLGQFRSFFGGAWEELEKCFEVSIGIETGPPIGSQKGPLPLVASGQRA